ncbi:hypothetical protein DFH06DRAFT_504279 [Mycena polygramma]|nr:hypothetical protein DFH06DRAFT_504279 [Mycena polygramma]
MIIFTTPHARFFLWASIYTYTWTWGPCPHFHGLDSNEIKLLYTNCYCDQKIVSIVFCTTRRATYRCRPATRSCIANAPTDVLEYSYNFKLQWLAVRILPMETRAVCSFRDIIALLLRPMEPCSLGHWLSDAFTH